MYLRKTVFYMDKLRQNPVANTVLLALVHHDNDMRPVILFAVPVLVILFAVLAPVIFREGTHACYISRGNSRLLYFVGKLTLVVFGSA